MKPETSPTLRSTSSHTSRAASCKSPPKGPDPLAARHMAAVPSPARQAGSEALREQMNTLRDLFQPLGAVIAGVHRGDVGEQRLRRADVAGRLFAADVLFARLQGEPQGRAAA